MIRFMLKSFQFWGICQSCHQVLNENGIIYLRLVPWIQDQSGEKLRLSIKHFSALKDPGTITSRVIGAH